MAYIFSSVRFCGNCVKKYDAYRSFSKKKLVTERINVRYWQNTEFLIYILSLYSKCVNVLNAVGGESVWISFSRYKICTSFSW